MPKTKTKLTAQTLQVNVLDTNKLSQELDKIIHKDHPDDKQVYKVRDRLALVLEPKLGFFDQECVGQTTEPFEILIYGEGIENGKHYFEAVPRYKYTLSLDEIKRFTARQTTLESFMGESYRPSHHRIGRNIESWLEYFNG